MPTHFGRFRLLNDTKKEIENVEFEGHLRVSVDGQPEIIIPPGEKREIPDGIITEVVAEQLP